MQRLGNLNNKLIVESIYEPDNKNVIWKDTVNNEFKEYNGSGWVKSENLDTPKEAFPYDFVKLPDFEYTTEEITKTSGYIKVGHIDIPEVDDSSKILYAMQNGPLQLISASNYVHELSSKVFSMYLKSTGPSGLYRILDLNGNQYVKATINGSSYIPAGTYTNKDAVLLP